MSTADRHSIGRFRSSALHYAIGRAFNALLSLGIFIWVARGLSVADYAVYVVLIATLEILLVVGNVGFDWVTAVEVPRLQAVGAYRELSQLVSRCMTVFAVSFGTLAAIGLAGAGFLAAMAGGADAVNVIRVYALVLLVEGLSRAVRDQMLASMLLQWAGQLAQTLRNFTVAAVLLILHANARTLDLPTLSLAEFTASGLSLIAGAGILWRRLGVDARAAVAAPQFTSDWQVLRHLAYNAWLASLTALLGSGQVILLLVSHLLGAEAAAVMGFGRNLAEQFRKLMPVEFLFNLIRTFLVARHTGDGDADMLLARVALFVKINLLLLLPAVLSMATAGADLCNLISKGRYAHANWIVLGWLVWVLAWSHHRLADAVAHLLKRSDVIGRASLLMMLVPPACAVALVVAGTTAMFVVLSAIEVAYVVLVLRLATTGTARYPLSVLALPQLALGCVLTVAVWRALDWSGTGLSLLMGIAVMLAGYLATMVVLRPLRLAELSTILGATFRLSRVPSRS